MENDHPKTSKFQENDWVELAENLNDPGPAIEMLKKIYRVQTAAELHPSLAFADKPWPSQFLGLSTAVIEHLHQARAIFMAKGFKVDSDPVNPLGDGKSWALVIEPTDNLPKGADPLDLARQCQRECVKGAAEPVWDGQQTILVPLWDSGCEDAIRSRAPQKWNTTLKPQSRSARSQRKEFVDPILKEKGWSSHEWASESHVDWHTVNDYLSGKTRPYPSTLKKLAGSLGLKPENLPE